jgi:hypothetical protein
VNRALRKPKPTSGSNQSQNKKTFNPKKAFAGKKANTGDDAKPKKSWGLKGSGDKRNFKGKFNKKALKEQAKKSFQGLTTASADGKKFKKPRWNKTDKKKKIIAEKLAS